ncbi:MAG: hypothetical protein HQ519_04845 [Planctomycetes bacterium]|nr:hypothetical protein [Planctomycetota bacterium]
MILRTLALLTATAVFTNLAPAQTHFWNQGDPGNWSQDFQWSPSGTVPNSASAWAALGVSDPTPYTVTMDMDVLLDRLELTAGNLTLLMSGRELTVNTAATIDNSILRLINSTVKGGGQVANRWIIDALGNSTIENLYNDGTLNVLGAPAGSSANLLLESPAYSEGTINVTSESGGYSATLRTGTGTTLSNFGPLHFLPGAGGSRTFSGALNNNFLTSVEANTTFNTGPITNTQNTFHVLSGFTATLSTNTTFNMNGGIFQNDGVFNQSDSEFNWNGGPLQNLAPNLINTALTLGASNNDTGTVRVHGNSTLNGVVRSGQNIDIVGSPLGSTATLTWQGTGDLFNYGAVDVLSESGGYSTNVIAPAGTRFVNNGTFTVFPGAGGSRNVNADMVNDVSGVVSMQVNTRLQTGPVENKGSWTVTPGALVDFNSSMAWHQSNGTLQVDGRFFHANGTDEFSGGTVNGLVELVKSGLTLGSGFTTPFTALVQGASTLSGDIESGQTLWARGSGAGSTATLSLAGPTENRGTLIADSTEGGYTVNVGTVDVALNNSGSFQVLLGAGGSRNLTGDFTNTGSVLVDANLRLKDGPMVNEASWTIQAGDLLNFDSSMVFNQNDGTLQIDGRFEHTNGTDNFNGGTVNGLVELIRTALTLDPNFTTPFQALVQGSSTLTGDIEAGQTLWARGSGAGSTATLNFTGAIENRGTLILDTTDGAHTTNVGTADVAFNNSGNLQINLGTAGARNLTGDITNTGSVLVDTNLRLKDGPIVNNGSWTVNTDQTLSFDTGMVFTQEGGTLQVDGTFFHNNGTDNFNGGTVNGRVELVRSTLVLDPNFTTPFEALVQGSSSLTGDVESGQTLWVRGSGAGSTATMSITGPTENRGTIIVDTTDGAHTSQAGTADQAFLNSGTLTVNTGAGGARNLIGDLTNDGTMQINTSTRLQDGPVINNGTFNVAAGKLVDFDSSMTFEQHAGILQLDGNFKHINGIDRFVVGQVNGVPELVKTDLILESTFTTPAEFRLLGASKLTGDVESGQSLRVIGAPVGGTATLTLQAPTTNHGDIEVTSESGGYTANFTAPAGLELSNEGSLTVLAGAGGPRSLSMELHNNGLVDLQTNTTLGMTGAAHQNSGTLLATAPLTLTGISFTNHDGGRVESNSTLTHSSYGLTNDGTFAAGPGIGLMTLNGDLNFGTTAIIEAQIGGTTPDTEYDRIVTSGNAILNGQIQLLAANGFEPQLGDAFTILNAASTSGSFSGVTYDGVMPLGYGWDVLYTGLEVVVFVAQTIEDAGPGSKVQLRLSDPTPGIIGRQNHFQVDGATGNGVVAIAYGLNSGSSASGICSGTNFGIDQAQQLGTNFASATGTTVISVFVPAAASGVTAYFQALDIERCELSPVNTFLFP